MKVNRTIAVALVTGFGFAGSRAYAQAAPSSMDSATVAAIKPERLVRFAVPDLGRVQGKVSGLSASSVTLLTGNQSRSIPLGRIDTVWVRARATRVGGIVGALLGLGGGLFLGALADGLCESNCQGDATATLGVTGTLVGAGAGALVGSAIPRWKKVHPR